MSKYGHRTINWFEALVNKLGGEAAAEALLRGELVVSRPADNQQPTIPVAIDYARLASFVSRDGMVAMEDLEKCLVPKWTVDNQGLIHFTLTSTGETGAEWADWFKTNDYSLGPEVEFILHSPSFQPSPVGTVYRIAVLPDKLWVTNEERTTANIRAKATSLGFQHGSNMNPEIVCLIRRTFSNEGIRAMGLIFLVGLHGTVSDSRNLPVWLGVSRYCCRRGMDVFYDLPASRWSVGNGFAVLAPVTTAPTTVEQLGNGVI